MNRQMLYAGALLALGLAACSDDRNSGPSAPELQLTGPACRYNTLKQYARNLFGTPSAGYDLAQAMSGQTANSLAATELGFDLFAEIARVRDAATETAPFTAQNVDDAANLVVQIIQCADVKLTGDNTYAAFAAALGPTGAWAVRGGADVTEAPVVTADLFSGVAAPGGNFNTWINGITTPFRRAVFLGYPRDPFLTGELTGTAAGITSSASYEWSLIRPSYISQTLTGEGKVTICIETTDDVIPDQFRIEKLSNILVVASPVSGLWCSPTTGALKRIPVGLAALPLGERMIRLTTKLLSPTPLYAAALGKSGSPTGSAGSFSPHNAANPVETVLSFAKQPADGRVNTNLPEIKVLATGDAGSPWAGVLIRLSAFNNNGTYVAVSGNEATTDANGIASFTTFKISKTGGYKLLAVTVDPTLDPDVVGFKPDSTTSKKFNVRP